MESVGGSRARRRSLRRNLLVFSSMLAGLASIPALAAAGNDGPVVNTIEGRVRGFTSNGVNQFLGIPYAAPPVGKLRWQPPQPVKKWKGKLDATHYGDSCEVTELQSFGGPASMSEDCLYINVFTTKTGRHGKGLPVIVWIYGGGNVEGESNDYDGSKLATGGPLGKPTVVVTFNYRLGLFGFLSEQHLNAEGHLWGNYGILDQQAALRWVQRNIAQFGGDPTRVTLGGQSAGAVDTGANVLSPLATGLFNRAIYQSSLPAFTSLTTAASALAKGNAFAAAVGCSNAKCLRGLSAARILQIQGTAKGNAVDPTINTTYTTGPFVDGTIIPHQPETAFTTGQYNRMPTMAGTVADEANFGAAIAEYFSGPPQVATTPEQYAAKNSAAVQAQYPLSAYDNNPQVAQDRVGTDPTKCQTLHALNLWASKIPTYAYDFTYTKAPFNFPQMPNAYSSTGHFEALAYHTADIQFLFPNFSGGILGVNLDQDTGQPRELQGKEVKLSDKLVAAWTNFAATGDPNGPNVPKWKRFKANTGTFLQQDIPISVETVAQYRSNYKCDFWDASLTYPTD
ncbi:carboxylesterase/lipase family protein [Hyphomicrobium sp.]|jgi:para-nitrobenzyl esterase|uniref:carboxylesterase/lipase family protein n=1 Tax=Hyphomicrobium sp. TaxID=82 RepID=UPI002C54C598|nr:carboxylesterase family protein [Hyphomicrobium sp.]HVZ04553.1 carboxylesterase family protein [Hyphomicrobium sp.]